MHREYPKYRRTQKGFTRKNPNVGDTPKRILTDKSYITVGVLAGAYFGGGRWGGGEYPVSKMRTHTIDWNKDKASLCGRVSIDHLADPNSDPDGLQIMPTCKACAKKDPRFKV